MLLIYLVLVAALDSYVRPLAVLMALPFGFAGAIYALYLHGLSLDLMAVVGILGLLGVVVNDALVLVSAVADGVRSGLPPRVAIERGAEQRFQAVLLTSLTTLAGVFPLAYGLLGEPGWIRPMVLAVGWGLLFATGTTLLFLPAALVIAADLGALLRRGYALSFGRLRRVVPSATWPGPSSSEEGA